MTDKCVLLCKLSWIPDSLPIPLSRYSCDRWVAPNHRSRTVWNTATKNCIFGLWAWDRGILSYALEAGTVEINDSRTELVQKTEIPPNLQAAINWLEKKYTTVISKGTCPSFSTDGASISHSQAAELFQLFGCPLRTGTDTERLFSNLQSLEDRTKAESWNTD